MASSAALGHQLSGARVCRLRARARFARARARRPQGPARRFASARTDPAAASILPPRYARAPPPPPPPLARHVAYNAPVAERDGKD